MEKRLRADFSWRRRCIYIQTILAEYVSPAIPGEPIGRNSGLFYSSRRTWPVCHQIDTIRA